MENVLRREKVLTMREIEEMLENKLPIDFEKAVCLVEYHFGLSEEKARRYINAIAHVRGWKIEDGVIKKQEQQAQQ